jgi:hypothetical protein
MITKHYSYIFISLITAFIFQTYGLSVKVLSEHQLLLFSVVENQIIHTGTDAYIRKVTHGNSLYILKQINDSSIDEQFLLINDCIASTIGFESGVPVNEVLFIPYNAGSHLKLYPERAATLHCIVPGQDLESVLPEILPANFSLHQRVINHSSVWQKKYPMSENQQGLSKLIIESMCCHTDLPLIAAFDCFVGNSDRSNPNLFYDAQTDSFYGIDQAAAFSKKLPSLALDRLNELMTMEYFDECRLATLDSLRRYQNMLRKLSDDVKPCAIIQSMKDLAFNLCPHALSNSEVEARTQYHSIMIAQNYLHTAELLRILDQILH